MEQHHQRVTGDDDVEDSEEELPSVFIPHLVPNVLLHDVLLRYFPAQLPASEDLLQLLDFDEVQGLAVLALHVFEDIQDFGLHLLLELLSLDQLEELRTLALIVESEGLRKEPARSVAMEVFLLGLELLDQIDEEISSVQNPSTWKMVVHLEGAEEVLPDLIVVIEIGAGEEELDAGIPFHVL